MAELEAESNKYMVRATLTGVAAKIDHVRKIAGIDAIGFGSDFDGISCTPKRLEVISQFPISLAHYLEKDSPRAISRKSMAATRCGSCEEWSISQIRCGGKHGNAAASE